MRCFASKVNQIIPMTAVKRERDSAKGDSFCKREEGNRWEENYLQGVKREKERDREGSREWTSLLDHAWMV